MGRTIYSYRSELGCKQCGSILTHKSKVEHLCDEGVFCSEDCSEGYIVENGLPDYKVPFPATFLYVNQLGRAI